MSEPMSTHDIEDVLSSIRRLVSEDLRPPSRLSDHRAQDQADPPVTAVPDAGKLILTPAFRVVGTAEEPVAVAEPEPELPAILADTAEPLSGIDSMELVPHDLNDSVNNVEAIIEPMSSNVEKVVARLGAAVGEADDEWESPVGDEGALSDDGWAGGASAQIVHEDASTVSAFPGFIHRARPALVTVAPAPEPSVAAAEPELAAPPVAVDAATFEPEAVEPEAVELAAVEEEAAAVVDEPEMTVEAVEAAPISFVAADTADEAPFAQDVAEDDFAEPAEEPVATVVVDNRWADVAEAAVMADLAQDAEAMVEDAAADLFEEDTDGGMVFDEQVLRELVRDIIREELAGTLGERITRNVRKLVRAEIARALAVREFE